MTNLELIRQGKHKAFNDLLKRLSVEEVASMISENSCGACICRDFCDNYYDSYCQQIVVAWLNEEEQKK